MFRFVADISKYMLNMIYSYNLYSDVFYFSDWVFGNIREKRNIKKCDFTFESDLLFYNIG